MKILVIEDEKKIAEFIRKGLEPEGFTVDVCHDGEAGLLRARAVEYDVVLIDIMLPGRDGLSVLSGLRDAANNVPVIAVTARDSLTDRLEGLNRGADDYLTKPFYIEELVARIHAVCRRMTGVAHNLRQAGDLVINLASREVKRGDTVIDLTAREFNLLEYLMRSPGRIYTRPQILEHVWNYHFDPSTNLVDVYVRRVRNKIHLDGLPPILETVRGVGYRIHRD